MAPEPDEPSDAVAPNDSWIAVVQPLGHELEVRAGESLIEAAWRAGYHWPTVCYGNAECTACSVEICSGFEHTSEIGLEEASGLELLRSRGLRNLRHRRLACRLEISGPVVVEKAGVRWSGVQNRH